MAFRTRAMMATSKREPSENTSKCERIVVHAPVCPSVSGCLHNLYRTNTENGKRPSRLKNLAPKIATKFKKTRHSPQIRGSRASQQKQKHTPRMCQEQRNQGQNLGEAP